MKLIRRIIRAVNRLPYAAARQLSLIPARALQADTFDILVVTRGRAILLSVLEDDEAASERQLESLDKFADDARAHCAFVTDVEGALRIIRSVRAEQIRLEQYAPERRA